MKEIKLFIVDAFTDQPFGGNPAGVVPHADGLSTDQMQKIAQEINASETAFLSSSDHQGANYRIRYFSPTDEVDFCGHATVAASWVLGQEYDLANQSERLILETNIGLVPVEWDKDGNTLHAVIMTQVEPQVSEYKEAVSDTLEMIGLKQSDIDDRFPVKLGYTGNWHLLIPVKTQRAIDQAKPLFDQLKEHNRNLGVTTTHLFTFNADANQYLLYTRDFAPAVGINEDPVTGSANGALVGYLLKEGKLPTNNQFLICQGNTLGRMGELLIKTKLENQKHLIQVGGKAVITIRGQLSFD